MQLPSNEIGISDILQYRDCPERMAYGMRRHVELPERFALYPGEKDDPPESQTPQTAYGSAIHDMLAKIEKDPGMTDEEAIDQVWPRWQHWLEPEDIPRFRADLQAYRKRSQLGWRVVAVELDMRVPLFVHNGVQIYFRFKIDILHQHMQNPGLFLMRDYKSSQWKKSEEEIHKDLQQWAYNFGVHEQFPECERLIQIYDELRYGETETGKSPQERVEIKDWLIRQVKAILNDDTLAPTQNEWCAWCPLVADCRETVRATTHWKNRLAAIAPEEKVGRKIIVKLDDTHGYDYYIELLPKAKQTLKMLERFVKTVEGTLLDMPTSQREAYGFTTYTKKMPRFSAAALQQIHRMFGPAFYQVASVSKTAVERFYGAKADEVEEVMALAERIESAPSLKSKS